MPLKYAIIVFITLFLIVCLVQILGFFTFDKDFFNFYKTAYIKELDRQYEVIADAFIAIKTMSRAAYAWVFLDDMQRKHSIEIYVYNSNSEHIPVPGIISPKHDDIVTRINSHPTPKRLFQIRNNKYYVAIPMIASPQCSFCHRQQEGSIIGIMTFEKEFNILLGYGKENAIIFGFFALIAAILLVIVMRWDPHKRIKEIFDK